MIIIKFIFTTEKGFRGENFGHIFGFEGERNILDGITGYFPDSVWFRVGKPILFRNGEWEGWPSEFEVPTVVKYRFESILMKIIGNRDRKRNPGQKVYLNVKKGSFPPRRI